MRVLILFLLLLGLHHQLSIYVSVLLFMLIILHLVVVSDRMISRLMMFQDRLVIMMIMCGRILEYLCLCPYVHLCNLLFFFIASFLPVVVSAILHQHFKSLALLLMSVHTDGVLWVPLFITLFGLVMT
jgi:hypothetical protein